MARVVWSRVARDDLEEIISYIRADAPAYARAFGLRLSQRLTQLEMFPESGRLVPEDPTETYRADGMSEDVLDLLHSDAA